MSAPGTADAMNRLRWRCRRGMLELDLLLLRFVDEDYAGATVEEQAQFEALLAMPDGDLWELLSGKVVAETPGLMALVKQVRRI